MKYTSLIFTLAAIAVTTLPWVVVSNSLEELYDQHDVQFEHSSAINTTFPNSFPDPDELITDLNDLLAVHKMSGVDYNAHAYWYVPKVWVLAPVVRPNSSDSTLIAQWKAFNHFPYLQEWVLHYYWNDASEWQWNMVLAAHSAFNRDDQWRYNTIFQVLPVLEEGDHMYYYLRDADGAYTRYTYKIYTSYETVPTDTSILHQSDWNKLLTAYTCYPIWTIDNRRVVQSELVETVRSFAVLEEQQPKDISQDTLPEPELVAAPLTRDSIPEDQQFELTSSSWAVGTVNDQEHWSASEPERTQPDETDSDSETSKTTQEPTQEASQPTRRQQLIALLLDYPLSAEFESTIWSSLTSSVILLRRRVRWVSYQTLKNLFVPLVERLIEREDLTKAQKIQRMQVYMFLFQAVQP